MQFLLNFPSWLASLQTNTSLHGWASSWCSRFLSPTFFHLFISGLKLSVPRGREPVQVSPRLVDNHTSLKGSSNANCLLQESNHRCVFCFLYFILYSFILHSVIYDHWVHLIILFFHGEIWFSKDRLLSNITPRFLTVEEVTLHPSSCKLWSKRFCGLF